MIQQMQPLPLEVQQLTATYQLGLPTAEFTPRLTASKWIFGILLFLIGAGFIVFSFAASNSDATSQLVLLLIGLAVVALGFSPFIATYLQRGLHVYVCPNGLVYVNGSKSDVIRWDQIEAVWAQVTRRYYNGVYAGTTHLYTVRRADGATFKFNDKFHKVGDLGTMIERESSRQLLPKAIAAYNFGAPVVFGKLVVSQQGVSNGKEMLPWSQVKGIRVNRGVVTVSKEGKWLNWANIPVSRTPNIFVFMALVNYIVNGRR